MDSYHNMIENGFYLDLYQLLNLGVAAVTNILAMYLVVTMCYWVYRLKNSRTNLRPFIIATLVAKSAVWFWTFLNMTEIVINNTNPSMLTFPARLGFLVAVIIQTWVTTKIKPAPHLRRTNLAEELKLGGKMVLIVEDSEPLARIYRRTIEMAGLNAEFVTSGADALIMIEQEKPCLMIVDLVLPDMDGIDLILKAKELGYDGPSVAISAALDLLDPNKLIPAKFNEILPKPIKLADLVRVAHRWAR